MFEVASCVWFPKELEFTYREKVEGIAFPVFLGGFGKRGEQALRNLTASNPAAGTLFRRARVSTHKA